MKPCQHIKDGWCFECMEPLAQLCKRVVNQTLKDDDRITARRMLIEMDKPMASTLPEMREALIIMVEAMGKLGHRAGGPHHKQITDAYNHGLEVLSQ